MIRRPSRAELEPVIIARTGYVPGVAPPARFAEGGDPDAFRVRFWAHRNVAALKAAGKTPEGFIQGFIEARLKRPGLTAAEYGVPDA